LNGEVDASLIEDIAVYTAFKNQLERFPSITISDIGNKQRQ